MVHRVQESVFQCPTVGEVEAEIMTVRMNRDKKFTPCPVVGCLGGACDSFGMFRHFAYRHPSATLTVDGRTWEKCALCRMQTANPIGIGNLLLVRNYRLEDPMKRQH